MFLLLFLCLGVISKELCESSDFDGVNTLYGILCMGDDCQDRESSECNFGDGTVMWNVYIQDAVMTGFYFGSEDGPFGAELMGGFRFVLNEDCDCFEGCFEPTTTGYPQVPEDCNEFLHRWDSVGCSIEQLDYVNSQWGIFHINGDCIGKTTTECFTADAQGNVTYMIYDIEVTGQNIITGFYRDKNNLQYFGGFRLEMNVDCTCWELGCSSFYEGPPQTCEGVEEPEIINCLLCPERPGYQLLEDLGQFGGLCDCNATSLEQCNEFCQEHPSCVSFDWFLSQCCIRNTVPLDLINVPVPGCTYIELEAAVACDDTEAPDPECACGIPNVNGTICCPIGCGVCGGEVCPEKTEECLGSCDKRLCGTHCCSDVIISSNRSCIEYGPPCNLEEEYKPLTSDGVIGGYVWSDLNGDGKRDPGEPGPGQITMELWVDSVCVGSTTTDEDGYYVFSYLPEGNYVISVTDEKHVLKDSTLTNGINPQSVHLELGEHYFGVNFGYKPPSGAIGGYVWFDLDGDGMRDLEESGASGILIAIWVNTADGPWLTSITTDDDGYYVFTHLPEGNYGVAVVDEENVFTDSILTAGVCPQNIYLGSGERYFGVVFGYHRPSGVIGGYVWCDLNGDGIGDLEEPGVGQVTIALWVDTHDGEWIGSTATDKNGYYEFQHLHKGSYAVTVTDEINILKYWISTGSSNTQKISLGHRKRFARADFGYQPPGIIVGRIWSDLNGDGELHPGEPGIGWVTLVLWLDTLDGPWMGSTTTDADGYYQFKNLPEGYYVVSVTDENEVVKDFVLVAGVNPLTIHLGRGETCVGADFGYKHPDFGCRIPPHNKQLVEWICPWIQCNDHSCPSTAHCLVSCIHECYDDQECAIVRGCYDGLWDGHDPYSCPTRPSPKPHIAKPHYAPPQQSPDYCGPAYVIDVKRRSVTKRLEENCGNPELIRRRKTVWHESHSAVSVGSIAYAAGGTLSVAVVCAVVLIRRKVIERRGQ